MKLIEIIDTRNIPLILRIINKHAFSGIPACDINGGDCFNWAAIAHQLIPNVELYSMWNHAFIEINGKFYDAEKPNGVVNWKNLPQNRSIPKYIQLDNPLSLQSFYRKWNINRKYINHLISLVKNEII